MIGIDLRSQLMGIVTSNQNYSKDSISNSNESSFDNIFDKAQFKQQKSNIHTKEKVVYHRDEYNKDIIHSKDTIHSKDSYYDKEVENSDIDNDKVSEQKTVQDTYNNQKEQEVVNTDNDITNKGNEVTNDDNEVSDENKEEFKDKTDINKKLENEILMLLSQMTGLKEDEITNWLMESGYEVSDLLNTSMFGEIISKMYLELKSEDVLLVENAVNDINEIYREIKNLESQIISNYGPGINNDSESIDAAILSGNVENVNLEAVMQDGNAIGTIQSIETNRHLSVKNTGTSEDVKPVSSVSGQIVEGSSSDLQSVMPISQFRTSGKLDFWSNEILNTAKANMMPSSFEVDIIKQIDLKQIGMSKELHIELNPRELGEMSIKLIEENSNIVAQISVDNEKTKDLLLSQIDVLKKSLEENGINIEDVTVDIKQNSHESQMQQEKQKSSKRIEELISKHMSGDDVDDEISEQIKISEVDYTA